MSEYSVSPNFFTDLFEKIRHRYDKKHNKTYDRYTKMAIDILTQVQNASDVSDISVKGYSTTEINEFLYECSQLGYVNFVDTYRDANSIPHFEHLILPGLTIEGYKFLNSLYASNALANSLFAKRCSIASIFISLLSVLVNIALVCLSILQMSKY